MSQKTIIYCGIRFCKNEIHSAGLMSRKKYLKLLIEYKWFIDKEGNCYCQACVREGLVK